MHEQFLSVFVRILTATRTSAVNFYLPTELRHPKAMEMWQKVLSPVFNLTDTLRAPLIAVRDCHRAHKRLQVP
jgi:hypothetical protein